MQYNFNLCTTATTQRTLTVGGRITVRLVSLFSSLEQTQPVNSLFFVLNISASSKLEKRETSGTVILPPTVRFLWLPHHRDRSYA